MVSVDWLKICQSQDETDNQHSHRREGTAKTLNCRGTVEKLRIHAATRVISTLVHSRNQDPTNTFLRSFWGTMETNTKLFFNSSLILKPVTVGRGERILFRIHTPSQFILNLKQVIFTEKYNKINKLITEFFSEISHVC